MAIDIFLIILGGICIIIGLVGSVLPGLPGPPISYIGLILMHLTARYQFSPTVLAVGLILVLATIMTDYILPVLGVRKWHGSKWGNIGCIVGTVVGIFFFPPWGIIFGPFLGATCGEILFANKKAPEALQAGFGALMGFLLGTALKLSVCGWFAICFIKGF